MPFKKVSKVPKGYRKAKGSTTAPAGYDMYVKGSLFDGTRKRVIKKRK